MDIFIQLIKEINDYLIQNEYEIIKFLRALPTDFFKRDKNGNLISFQIEGNSFSRRQDPNIISVLNLQLLLNLGNKFLTNKVLNNFYNSNYIYESERIVYDVRKIRFSIKNWFNFPNMMLFLSDLNEIFERFFAKLETNIIDEVLWKLDDYTNGIMSATILANKMHRYKDYLTTPKNWFLPFSGEYFEFSSIFNFITHLLFIDFYIPIKEDKKIKYFIEDILIILFEHFSKLGVFDLDSKELYYIQFRTLSFVLFTSTVINIKKHSEDINPFTIKNYMVILPSYASHLGLSINYFPGLFKKNSIISKTTVLDMQRDLIKNKEYCTLGYKKALKALDDLINLNRFYSYRAAYVGILSHSILEDLLSIELIEKGYTVEFESLINLPHSLHRADLLIKDINNQFNSILYFKEDIDSIAIDFTISEKEKYIIDKMHRNYQKSNRLLYIILYSENRHDLIKEYIELLEELHVEYKENIRIMPIEDFSNILRLSNNKKRYLFDMLEIFYKAIEDDNYLERLEYLNTKSLESLESLFYDEEEDIY